MEILEKSASRNYKAITDPDMKRRYLKGF